jgi:phosphoglycolate phosphatase-like HAD superfamily hydrolase
MIARLMRRFRARPDETIFVGDMPADEAAARDADCRFQWAHEFFGWDGGQTTGASGASGG